MRIARILGALVFAVMLSQPVFACRDCADNGTGWFDCQIAHYPTDGCIFTQDGCIVPTPPNPCNPGYVETWTVASVEIEHAPSMNDATPVVAVAAVQPAAKLHSTARSNTR
jgi:hypothetical protein